MTDLSTEQKRILLAQWRGFRWQEGEMPVYGAPYLAAGYYDGDKFIREELPDYFGCRNAVAELEARLTDEQRIAYAKHLYASLKGCVISTWEPGEHDYEGYFHLLHANAAQRAEALGTAISLW